MLIHDSFIYLYRLVQTESEYSKVPVMAMCLGTLAMIPENVNRIMKFGGVPPLVELMHMVSGMPSCPAQEEILSALSLAMREILGNVPAGRRLDAGRTPARRRTRSENDILPRLS